MIRSLLLRSIYHQKLCTFVLFTGKLVASKASHVTIHDNDRWADRPRRETSSSTNDRDDAFRLFSLPYKFRIDHDALHSTYREIMKQLHPDMQHQVRHQHHSQQSNNAPSVDSMASDDPSVVTNAYQTLKRPHLRAMHLLEILGHSIDQEETSNMHGGEFLMEVMELRHEIESASTDAELKPLFDLNLQRIHETCNKLDTAIEAQEIREAWRLTGELQYWNRIDETLREKMESMDG